MLKSNDERVVVNDYLENDPLSENNLDKTLNLVNEFRLSCPQKTIWLYSGYTFEEIVHPMLKCNQSRVRKIILKNINVLVDGRYIDSLQDLSYPFAGSRNQRVIDVLKSIENEEVVLYK